jgi:hypothetical protein
VGLWRIRHANVDADPQEELFITTSQTYDGKLVCDDSVTHQRQWTQPVIDSQSYRALEIADVNLDGHLEIVASVYREIHRRTGNVPVRVRRGYRGAGMAQHVDRDILGFAVAAAGGERGRRPAAEIIVAEFGGQVFITTASRISSSFRPPTLV